MRMREQKRLRKPWRCCRCVNSDTCTVRWLVVDAGAITELDFTAARALIDLQQDLARKGVVLALTRVSNNLRADLDRQEVAAALGHHRIFTSRKQSLAAYEAAGVRHEH
jgi:sulfate permease, SulP family